MENQEQVIHSSEGDHEYPIFCPATCDAQCMDTGYVLDLAVILALGILCVFVSLWHISKHLKYFTNPEFQAKIIIILLMAPFYCIISVIEMFYPPTAPYLTVIRDSYEAFLLLTFFYLIFAYLAYDEEKDNINDFKLYNMMIVPEHGERVKVVYHMWPFNYCGKPYKLSSTGKAKYFTYRCKKMVLQCFVLKPIAAIIYIICTPFQDNIYVTYFTYFVSTIICISVSYSLYYLILFYYALKKPLAPYNPLLKFLVVKITLFFTFWQALVIVYTEEYILECFDQSYKNYDGQKIVLGLENTLICFEMLIMALAGGPAFTFHEFKNNGQVQRGKFFSVIQHLIKIFKDDFRLIKPKKLGIEFQQEERELFVPEKLSDTSIGAEYKIEVYDNENGETYKFQYVSEKKSNLNEGQPEKYQEVEMSNLNNNKNNKNKKKRPQTDLTQLLIPDNH